MYGPYCYPSTRTGHAQRSHALLLELRPSLPHGLRCHAACHSVEKRQKWPSPLLHDLPPSGHIGMCTFEWIWIYVYVYVYVYVYEHVNILSI